MGLHLDKRNIPRVWEVDWSIPAAEGGTPWAAYQWLLQIAHDLRQSEVTILGATYDQLGGVDRALGQAEASALRTGAHQYRTNGINVHGMTTRGGYWTRGPVLIAWANEEVLAAVEGQHAPAVAAVASWPDSIATWRATYAVDRVGQVRADQEADYDTSPAVLDPYVAETMRSAAALVNENHAVLSTHERERVAGALIALRSTGVPVDIDALRGLLMAAGWNGKLIKNVAELAERVARGERPRHATFALPKR